jgi:glycyl-tRNA synthetase beta chain
VSAARNLLVELFVEELPPKALKRLGDAFANGIVEGLRSRGLVSAGAASTAYASPRRLAVHVSGVAAQAPDREVVEKLMAASVALGADGRATEALKKRLAKMGRGELAAAWPESPSGPDRLSVEPDGKADAIFLHSLVRGSTLVVGLQGALQEAIDRLPIPKVMQYQLADGWSSVRFVRPAHGLVALQGAEVVPVSALGLEAGRTTQGHRFEAARPRVDLRDADSYAVQLREEGAVIASFGERRAEIERRLLAAAATEHLAPIDDPDLLDEVTALVERPNVLTCRFEREFLDVPQECLILTMKANQKYFPLLDAAGKLTERFLVVSNISPADPSRVVEGNERVIRPRLADAKFFYDQDRKKRLEDRVPGLDKVVYHNKLGTQGARVARLRAIARFVAARIGADEGEADRAALLAKADLLTDMVGEFPELQGVMGGYYAAHDGERPAVVAAIRDQYLNRRDPEAQGTNLVGEALLIADRAEALVGIWGVGGKPTGDKDPFALRRHALALISAFETLAAVRAFAASARTVATAAPQTSTRARTPGLLLDELLRFTASTFAGIALQPDTVEQVETFIYERYANQLAAQPRYPLDAVTAVLGPRPPLQEVVKRLDAVLEFQRLDESPALAAANKRVGNILKKSAEAIPAAVEAALLREPDEIALHRALAEVRPQADARFASGDYAASLKALAALRGPVDAFFDRVMVNAEDPALRANRLALLSGLHAAMNRVADLSKLAA